MIALRARVLLFLATVLLAATGIVVACLWLTRDARSFFLGLVVGALLASLASRLVDALVVICWGSALATYYHGGRKK
jgi:hypothetical protein